MIDEQFRPSARRNGRPVRAVTVFASLLLLLYGVAYFAVESLEADGQILNLVMVVALGSCALALVWVVVGGWWGRRADRSDRRRGG